MAATEKRDTSTGKVTALRSGDQLTRDMLVQRMRYDPETGLFWSRTRFHGKPLGSDQEGYVRISILRQRFMAHRLAYLYMEGEMPPEPLVIDHINSDRSDNRWCNLRILPRADNSVAHRYKQMKMAF